MAPARSTCDPRSVWSSSLRPPLDLQRAVLPEDDDDDRAVAELLNAALEGDLSRVKELVKELTEAGKGVGEAVEAAAVGVTGTKRRGPLHLAAANGKAEMCRYLIKNCDVDVDATDSDGATPLIYVIQGLGSTTIVRLLLNNGANPNKADNSGVAPLHISAERVQIAACQGWKECVEILFPVTTPLAEYATWSIDGIIQHEKTVSSEPQLQVSDLDDKENAVSDDNMKDTQPHQSKPCSKKGNTAVSDDNTKDTQPNQSKPCSKKGKAAVSDDNTKHTQPNQPKPCSKKGKAAVSDDNTKDTQPHQLKPCSKKGKALTTMEENGGGIETLMSGLNLGPEDPSDKASGPPLRRSTRARQPNVRISGPEWAR